ncbi:MAG: S8 family serine peptidase [Candidatus Cybelea sp.]
MRGTMKLVTPVIATIALAACNVGTSSVGGTIVQSSAEARAIPACTDKRPGRVRCAAVILEGRVVSDGGSGPDGGFTPAQLQAAYNLPSAGGTGQVVAIADAYDNPNVASDLAFYRSYFGLPRASFYKYNQNGQQDNYPQSCMGHAGWCLEIDLDVEMVSAICPNCIIYLVESNSNADSDLQTAEAEAVTLGAHIISNSYYCFGTACQLNESYYDTSGVTYLGAAGDDGYGMGVPADFDHVVAVGGTHLVQGGGKRGWTETVWGGAGFGPDGTGAACSTEPKPSWQRDPGCTFRTGNDVAAVADPFTGVAEYDTYGYSGWFIVGGTSVSTPILASVFALAGNATKQDGGRTFWGKNHQKAGDLNPVSRGSDGQCSPTYLCTDGTNEYKDYGGPTGWGTPNGIGAF